MQASFNKPGHKFLFMKKITFAVLFFFVISLAHSQNFSTFSFTSSNIADGPSQWGNYGCYANGSLTNSNCLPTGLPSYFTGSYPMFQSQSTTYGTSTSVLEYTHSTGTGKFVTFPYCLTNGWGFQTLNIYFSSSLKAYFGGFDILNKSSDGLSKIFTVNAFEGSTLVGTKTVTIPYNVVTNVSTVNTTGFNSVDKIQIVAPTDNLIFGVNNFSLKGQSTLPVELTSFNANCTENATTINWQTASEHNSAYFDIEKSRDGATWNVIKTVNAAGNSTSTIDYSTIDSEKAMDVVYYRLNQVDIDGASKIYGPISISCDETNDFTATIFPNPTAKDFSVSFLNSEAQNFDIQLIGTDGKVVYQTTRLVEAGATILPLSSEYLNAGVYSLHVKGENTLKTIKLVVQ